MSTTVYKGMLGKVFTRVEADDEEVRFYEGDEVTFKLYHEQDCCEGVSIETIDGDLHDLVDQPILMAEGVYEDGEKSEWGESSTWSVFKFATVKGYVTVRFYGSSNGYYSETADLVMKNPDTYRGWESLSW